MQRHVVEFIDTSVLLELLDVPGKASQHERVKVELQRKARTVTMILPTAAIIETGNHICGLSNGYERRDRAVKFSQLLDLSVRARAPWQLHRATWDERLLKALRDGARTGQDLIEHATRRSLGAGDLSILAERDLYRQGVSSQTVEVRVWTLDSALSAYAQ